MAYKAVHNCTLTVLSLSQFDFRASRDRRYDRADGQVNYAVVHGQPQVNPRKDTRTDHLASKKSMTISAQLYETFNN